MRYEDLQALLIDLDVVPKLLPTAAVFKAFTQVGRAWAVSWVVLPTSDSSEACSCWPPQVTQRDLLRGCVLGLDDVKHDPPPEHCLLYPQFLELLVKIAHQVCACAAASHTCGLVQLWLEDHG
jgi:hypothetical protein